MTTYELTVVLPTNKEKQVFDRVKKVLDTAGARVQKTDEWGKRTLAYPINKQIEAVYYALVVDMDTDKTDAVNRVLENDDDILRHMIVVARKEAKNKEQSEKAEKKSTKKEAKAKVETEEKKEVKSEKKPTKATKTKGKSKK